MTRCGLALYLLICASLPAQSLCEALILAQPNSPKIRQLVRVGSRRGGSDTAFWRELRSELAAFDGRRKIISVRQDGYFADILIRADRDQLRIEIEAFGLSAVAIGTRPDGPTRAFGDLVHSLVENTQDIIDRAPGRFSSVRIDGKQIVNPGLAKVLEKLGFQKKRNYRKPLEKALIGLPGSMGGLLLKLNGTVATGENKSALAYWLAGVPASLSPLALGLSAMLFPRAADYSLVVPLDVP